MAGLLGEQDFCCFGRCRYQGDRCKHLKDAASVGFLFTLLLFLLRPFGHNVGKRGSFQAGLARASASTLTVRLRSPYVWAGQLDLPASPEKSRAEHSGFSVRGCAELLYASAHFRSFRTLRKLACDADDTIG